MELYLRAISIIKQYQLNLSKVVLCLHLTKLRLQKLKLKRKPKLITAMANPVTYINANRIEIVIKYKIKTKLLFFYKKIIIIKEINIKDTVKIKRIIV